MGKVYVLVAVAVVVALVLLVVAGVLLARRGGKRRAAARMAAAELETPWRGYCRPDGEGVWHYGAERVCSVDGEDVEFGRFEIGVLPPGVDELDRQLRVADAMDTAARYNRARDETQL